MFGCKLMQSDQFMRLSVSRVFYFMIALFLAACESGIDSALDGTSNSLNTGFYDGTASPGFSQAGYKLGPNDKLRLIVFGEDNLSGEFVVSGTGSVSLPLIGGVKAQGLTIKQFEESITAKYKNGYLNDPKVSVEVLNYRPFFITGEVKNGGEYPYKNGLTVQDAVAVAGGYTYRANTDKVHIRRAGQNQEIEVQLNQRIPIVPGDNIKIPERYF